MSHRVFPTIPLRVDHLDAGPVSITSPDSGDRFTTIDVADDVYVNLERKLAAAVARTEERLPGDGVQ